MRFIVSLILLALIFSSCTKKAKSPFESTFISAFNLIRSNYIKTEEVNWKNVEKNVEDSIKYFRNKNDVYAAIEYTIDLLNDNHSKFLMPDENAFRFDTIKIPEIQTKVINGNIGYLKIPGLAANDSISTLFALEIRKAFKKLDESMSLAGWIIDLSDNRGGVFYAQHLGISPLFQDSILGYTLDNKGKFQQVTCHDNTFCVDGRIIRSIDYDFSLKNRNRKVAVLINGITASCGERVALALRNHAGNAKIFGQSSKGLQTGLMKIDLQPSGAAFLLSVEYNCDIDKNIIMGPVIPDVVCSSDESFDNAIEWINNAI